ncbi:Uncharacterised protein [Yersinia enterocolitica]|nr:Uncharacterised protein [Yersinia enterocolitica]SUP63138.1 Uncharacterised protein [Yersinia enterocolitica]
MLSSTLDSEYMHRNPIPPITPPEISPPILQIHHTLSIEISAAVQADKLTSEHFQLNVKSNGGSQCDY